MQKEKKDMFTAQATEQEKQTDNAINTESIFGENPPKNIPAEKIEDSDEDWDFIQDEKTERELRELKEAKKMKIRKVLYPIAVILIIAIWASCFLEK